QVALFPQAKGAVGAAPGPFGQLAGPDLGLLAGRQRGDEEGGVEAHRGERGRDERAGGGQVVGGEVKAEGGEAIGKGDLLGEEGVAEAGEVGGGGREGAVGAVSEEDAGLLEELANGADLLDGKITGEVTVAAVGLAPGEGVKAAHEAEGGSATDEKDLG